MPAWNEEGSVADVIKEVRVAEPAATILVIDDGSTDRTSEVARAAGATVMTLPFNMGVGGALRAGYRYALRNDFDAMIQVDADGQHDPADISKMVAQLESADLVIGARFAGVGAYEVHGPRAVAMKFMAKTLTAVTKTKLTDATSGYKLAGRRAIALFAHTFPEEYLGDTIEALVLASKAGLKIAQVPVSMRERSAGVASANSFKSTIYLLRAILALALAVSRRPVRPEGSTP